MVIEIAEKDFKAIQDSAREIRSLALKAWMGKEKERPHCLKEIVFQVNIITNLMFNGEIVDEVELSR